MERYLVHIKVEEMKSAILIMKMKKDYMMLNEN